MEKIDKRTNRGRELAERLNKQTILDNMPKIYFVEDLYHGGYRVGRTDWAPDQFEIIPLNRFEIFKEIMDMLAYPLLDKTNEEGE